MTWVVELVGAQPQEFLDLQDIGGQHHELKPEFFEKLRTLAKQEPNYRVRTGAIRSIKGSKSVPNSPFVLVLVTSAGLAVKFLGGVADEGARRVVGVWPAEFRAILETDGDAVINLLYIVAERPEAVRYLEVVF